MESDAISRCVCVCPCRRVCVHMCACAHVFAHTLVTQSCLTLCNPNSPGQNTGVGSHSLLQQIFPTQESNQGLLHCRRILYQLSHQGSPSYMVRSVKYWQRSSKTKPTGLRYREQSQVLVTIGLLFLDVNVSFYGT